MAQNFRQTISVQGDGAPTDGDGLSTNLAIFPIGRIYVDSLTATLYVRNTDVGVAADWVEGGSAGDSFYGNDGTLTGDRAVALNGNSISFNQGVNSFLSLDPTANAESATLQAYNTTGSDNSAVFQAVTTDLTAEVDISAFFNGGAKAATIELLTDTTTSTIDYTADQHIFTGNVGIGLTPVTRFQVESATPFVDALRIDLTTDAEDALLRAYNATGSDNLGSTYHTASATSGTFTSTASFNGGAKVSTIFGSANTSDATITHTADRSIFNGRLLKKQGADVASAVGAITLGSGGNVFEITGTSAITLISNVGWQNGAKVTLLFTSTASLTDGTANSGTNIGFELAGGANFTGSADDAITLVLSEIGGTQRWREVCRSVN